MDEFKSKKTSRNHLPNLKSGGLFISIWYIIAYECLAVLEILVMKKYQTTEFSSVVRSTFTLVVGFVVGYMVTMTFQIGLAKFQNASQVIYEKIFGSLMDFSCKLVICSTLSHPQQGSLRDPLSDTKAVWNDLKCLKSAVQSLPYLCKHSVMTAGWREETWYHDSGPPLLFQSRESFYDPARANLELGAARFAGRKTSRLEAYEILPLAPCVEEAIDNTTDHLRDVHRFCVLKMHGLKNSGFLADCPEFGQALADLDATMGGVMYVQALYSADIPPAYFRFVWAVVNLYVIIAPIMCYNADYYWLVLIVYPVIIYLFITPHLLGLRLSKSLDYKRETTFIPVGHWCKQICQHIKENFDLISHN